jgi:hypothetical protein
MAPRGLLRVNAPNHPASLSLKLHADQQRLVLLSGAAGPGATCQTWDPLGPRRPLGVHFDALGELRLASGVLHEASEGKVFFLVFRSLSVAKSTPMRDRSGG